MSVSLLEVSKTPPKYSPRRTPQWHHMEAFYVGVFVWKCNQKRLHKMNLPWEKATAFQRTLDKTTVLFYNFIVNIKPKIKYFRIMCPGKNKSTLLFTVAADIFVADQRQLFRRWTSYQLSNMVVEMLWFLGGGLLGLGGMLPLIQVWILHHIKVCLKMMQGWVKWSRSGWSINRWKMKKRKWP